jgi:hypothetical protein
MKIKRRLLEKPIAACMVLLLAVPVARAEPLPGQESASGKEAQGSPPTATQQTASNPASTPNSAPNSAQVTTAQSPGVEPASSSGSPAPGAEVAQSGDQNGGQSTPANSSQSSSSQSNSTQSSSSQPSSSQSNGDQQQNGATQPVGTAAAPAVKGTGVAGSRVSGAAIAPAKQRRVRTFLISIGVVVAACVAVGAVVALTHATPSQPR